MTNTTNDQFPPVRLPRKLRDDLQTEANEIARSRGKNKMTIADLVAEMWVEYKDRNSESEEEG